MIIKHTSIYHIIYQSPEKSFIMQKIEDLLREGYQLKFHNQAYYDIPGELRLEKAATKESPLIVVPGNFEL